MCGIYGFAKINDAARSMSPLLALQMEVRGGDAWGATDGRSTVIKHLGGISLSYTLPPEWTRGIFHTRNGTTGQKNAVDNAHPHRVGNIVGIHNGIISSHEELNKKYSRDFPVDSIHIFAHIAEGKSLGEMHGYAACAWYDDNDTDDRVWLMRSNNDALHIARLVDGNCVFASTDSAIVRAAKLCNDGAGIEIKYFYDTRDDQCYYIASEDDGETFSLYHEGRMALGTRYHYDSRTSGANNRAGFRGARNCEAWTDDYYGGEFEPVRNRSHSSWGNSVTNPSANIDYHPSVASGGTPDHSIECVYNYSAKCNGVVAVKDTVCDECLARLVVNAGSSKQIPNGLTQRVETLVFQLLEEKGYGKVDGTGEPEVKNQSASC